jgi:hypothetical protein
MRNRLERLPPKDNTILAQYLLVVMSLKGYYNRVRSGIRLDQKCRKVINALAYRKEVRIIQSNIYYNGPSSVL